MSTRKAANKVPEKEFFTFYKVKCRITGENIQEPVFIELSPFAILTAAYSLHDKTAFSIESCLADAVVNVMRSINDQFLILDIIHT